MNINMPSNEEVSDMGAIFGTAVPPLFLRFGFWMLKLNENWLTIGPELGHSETSAGCQFENLS
jgi:hypothetical protein